MMGLQVFCLFGKDEMIDRETKKSFLLEKLMRRPSHFRAITRDGIFGTFWSLDLLSLDASPNSNGIGPGAPGTIPVMAMPPRDDIDNWAC